MTRRRRDNPLIGEKTATKKGGLGQGGMDERASCRQRGRDRNRLKKRKMNKIKTLGTEQMDTVGVGGWQVKGNYTNEEIEEIQKVGTRDEGYPQASQRIKIK